MMVAAFAMDDFFRFHATNATAADGSRDATNDATASSRADDAESYD